MMAGLAKINQDDFWLRLLCVLACIPSGGALLAKVFGLASMQLVTTAVFLPGALFLVLVWLWARRRDAAYLRDGLVIGFWGGLFGTFGYDLARIPFLLLGQRVFAPITTYGVWLAEAAASSRFTDVLGWAYHFSNGITFGIMFALLMRRRHWFWAILWAMALETIAILSPFAPIFNLSGNYGAIGIAYLGHLAYGLPLGYLVYHWDETRAWLARWPGWVRWGWLAVGLLALVLPLLWPGWVARDERRIPGAFHVEAERLNPTWLRIERNEAIDIVNSDVSAVTVQVKSDGRSVSVAGGATAVVPFEATGIYQLYVETEGQTRSSFVIVEPVEERER